MTRRARAAVRALLAMPRSMGRLLAGNARTLLAFEALYTLVLSFVVAPVLRGLLWLMLRACGTTYVADCNVAHVVSSPMTWLVCAAAVAILASYALFEMSALAILYHASRLGRRLSMARLLVLAGPQALRVVRRRNLPMYAFILLMLPIVGVGVAPTIVDGMHIPEFVVEYVEQNAVLDAVFVAIMLGLSVVAFYWIFTLHFFTLRGEPFAQAHRSSRALVRGQELRLLAHVVAFSLVVAAAVAVLADPVSVGAVMRLMNAPALSSADGQGASALVVVTCVATVAYDFVLNVLGTILSYAWLSAAFYDLLDHAGDRIDVTALGLPEPRLDKGGLDGRVRVSRCVTVAVGACVLLGAVGTAVSFAGDDLASQAAGERACSVTAHRGGALAAPENTLEAFSQAIADGADWVELDVRQTADGVVVVSHDATTKRTTGVDLRISDVTYDQLRDLDNSAGFDVRFSGVRVCTLEEAIRLCRGHVRMNIEIKAGAGDEGLVERVVDLVNAYDMAGQVVIASTSYETLMRVKACDPGVATLYDMAIAYGDVGDLADADEFSVDEAFVTRDLVRGVHERGRRIIAWTVDDLDNATRLYALGVDGVVTNDVPAMRALFGGQAA